MTDREWATKANDLCPAVCFMRDDHWGKVAQKCELIYGHSGDHACQLRATEPLAVLTWPSQSGDTKGGE